MHYFFYICQSIHLRGYSSLRKAGIRSAGADVVEEHLFKLIKGMQEEKRIMAYDEASTKQGVILRILSHLGWDTYNVDEVCPEYSVHERRVDFSLRYQNHDEVFIEVKKIGEDLEKHQEQLLDYSFRQGVKLAVLTNGISWWFYLPIKAVEWQQRKYYTIDLYDQDAGDITKNFIAFLSKENVTSGQAEKNAEDVYRSQQKTFVISETLPKAWEKLIREPDEALIELLAETTEKLCGHRPDNDTATAYLKRHYAIADRQVCRPKQQPIITPPLVVTSSSDEYTGKTLTSFSLLGKRQEAKAWIELLLSISTYLASNHRSRFDAVLRLAGRKRPYFSTNQSELRTAKKINGTDIYVETNLSANQIVKISNDLLELFGYKKADLVLEYR